MLYKINFIDRLSFIELFVRDEIRQYPHNKHIFISKDGRLIISIRKSRRGARKNVILKQNTYRNGYKYVKIYDYDKKKSKSYLVHRLVAETWIPNLYNLSDVDHINSIRDDNNYTNLQWLSHLDNCKKIRDIGRRCKYGVLLFNNDGSIHKVFSSIKEASMYVNGSYSGLKQKLKGPLANNIYKNRKWQLIENVTEENENE